jgi:choline dehydrogenase/5-(hydroxymethyl)furfural/furfural oxidase
VRWDRVIVGAGAAGCVLAARLSDDPDCSVLLLEAGPEHADGAPADVFAALEEPGRWWDGLDAVRVAGGAAVPYARGFGVGGSSAVNGLVALRGLPADYDGWERDHGVTGWGWRHVVTAFVRAERTLGVAVTPTVGAVDRAVAAACPELAGAPLTVDGGRRTSVVDRYLDPARSRPNLTVRASTPVERVLLDGTRVVGVGLAGDEVVEAAEVVVSAGAIHSPALLVRSGVEREGIGANLRDHPAVGITVALDDPVPGGLPITATAALSSGSEPGDLQILPINHLSPGVGAYEAGMVMVALMKVRSSGRVRTTHDEIAVDLALLSDQVDADAFDVGIDRLLAIVDGGAWDGVGTPFVPDELRDPARRLEWVRTNLGAYVHAAGTCRMGRRDDPLAVVDAVGAVIGYDGLRVVDASIFPDLPRANTNLPTVMVAERIAQWLRAAR